MVVAQLEKVKDSEARYCGHIRQGTALTPIAPYCLGTPRAFTFESGTVQS